MFPKIKFLFLIALTLSLSLSCKKGCDYPDDNVNTGAIIVDANVLGFNTGGVKSVHYTESPSNPMKVSFDKGYTYVLVDFSKYTIMNFPIVTGCNTHFERDVTINASASRVTYTLKVDACPDCEEQYLQDNWVLVPAFPVNYQVVYSKK